MTSKPLIKTDGNDFSRLLFFLFLLYLVGYVANFSFLNTIVIWNGQIHLTAVRFFYYLFGNEIISSIQSNVVCLTNNKCITVGRLYFNFGSYLVLFFTLYFLPISRLQKLRDLFVWSFVLFIINILHVLYSIKQTAITGIIPSVDEKLFFRFIAELMPMAMVVSQRFFVVDIFDKIRVWLNGLSLKNYVILLLLFSFYIASVLTDFFTFLNLDIFASLLKFLTFIHLLLSKFLLSIVQFDTYIQDNFISDYHGMVIHVANSCLGLKMMAFYGMFILLYKGKISLKEKLKFVVAGIGTIFFMNVLRIVILFIIYVKHGSLTFLFTDHHELFNLVIYLTIFSMFFLWVRYVGKRNSGSIA